MGEWSLKNTSETVPVSIATEYDSIFYCCYDESRYKRFTLGANTHLQPVLRTLLSQFEAR